MGTVTTMKKPKKKIAAEIEPRTVRFALERETKGAVRYNEIDDNDKPLTTKDEGCLIGALYLRKDELPDGEVPQSLTVTINFD